MLSGSSIQVILLLSSNLPAGCSVDAAISSPAKAVFQAHKQVGWRIQVDTELTEDTKKACKVSRYSKNQVSPSTFIRAPRCL